MTGVEINMVVKDCLRTLDFYEKIFDIKRVEVTNLSQGENEAIFTLYSVRFHMLDENPSFGLFAPKEDTHNTIWFNVLVPDIKETFSKALNLGCKEIQGVTEIPEFGVSNAIFSDPFGYVWLLHQVHKEVSFEERMRYWEEKRNK